jgi:hypothetical protein
MTVSTDYEGLGYYLRFSDKDAVEDFFLNCDLGCDDSPLYFRDEDDYIVFTDDADKFFDRRVN